jgi:Cof subfamily protein (haloacid dehalogenase superfamily)
LNRKRVKYKLCAVDLDGTLLDPSGLPHEVDLRALLALREAGVHVTIVTGRLYSGTRPVAEQLGLRGPVACVDGSQIVSTETHRSLHTHAFSGKRALALREAMTQAGAATFLFAQDQVVYDSDGVPYLGYVSTWSTSLVAAGRTTAHPFWEAAEGVTAVVAVGEHEQIQRAVDAIATHVGEHAQVAMFPARTVEDRWGMIVRASGGDKGTALRFLADHYQVALEEVVAVGDWLNDIPMLRVAGRSFAMGHAPEVVKSTASDRLKQTSLEGGGVAFAIEAAFGIKAT